MRWIQSSTLSSTSEPGRSRLTEDTQTLLSIENLAVQFDTRNRRVRAVDDVSLQVQRGETLAVVGESGSGKSVTAMAILRLLESQGGRVVNGRILFEGHDIQTMSDAEVRALRGNEIAMVFQEPMTSLNPVYTIGNQIGEVLSLHRGMNEADTEREVVRLLELVDIPDAARRANEYPHQLSGGMRQRVMIAMALACRPKLLIADEPTTALDVTIQAQILELLRSLQQRLGMAVLLITHDLGVVAATAHRVAVMYAGRIVESATVEALFEGPRHPYSAGLLRSLPSASDPRAPLMPILGNVPDPQAPPTGCRFHPRCELRLPRCEHEVPVFELYGPTRSHGVACHYAALHPAQSLALDPRSGS
jgi:oligopeptide/dipeptide ABC transporter ATP-binding protein